MRHSSPPPPAPPSAPPPPPRVQPRRQRPMGCWLAAFAASSSLALASARSLASAAMIERAASSSASLRFAAADGGAGHWVRPLGGSGKARAGFAGGAVDTSDSTLSLATSARAFLPRTRACILIAAEFSVTAFSPHDPGDAKRCAGDDGSKPSPSSSKPRDSMPRRQFAVNLPSLCRSPFCWCRRGV